MLKYLRIAASALSLAACLLLIELWVRSSWNMGMDAGDILVKSISAILGFAILLAMVFWAALGCLLVVVLFPRRFALRTLLIATTLVAVVLGAIVAAY